MVCLPYGPTHTVIIFCVSQTPRARALTRKAKTAHFRARERKIINYINESRKRRLKRRINDFSI